LGEFVFEDDFSPSTTDCTIEITDPNNAVQVSPTIMSERADGWHYYDYTTAGNAPIGVWRSVMICGTAGGGDLVKADKSFIVDTAASTHTAQDVWDVATADLTTAGSIGKALTDNRFVQFNTIDKVVAGSGTNNYKAKLYIYDLSSALVNAANTPSITLFQPDGAIGAGPTNMTLDATGIYSYQTTLGSGAVTGGWEAVVTLDTVTSNTIKVNGFFELQSSPARVTINSITDNTVPSITANFAIANEGNVGNEYHYEYCVVSTIENVCGGGDDIAYALAAEFIEAGVEEEFNKTLTVNTIGTYFWKVAVYWSTERSVAVLQYNAVAEESSDGGGGDDGGGGGDGGGGDDGGGDDGGEVPAPTASCSGADFNRDRIVNSVDFSILLYFWKTKSPFRNPCVDINKDKQVNSIDFSILLFQWGKPGVNIK